MSTAQSSQTNPRTADLQEADPRDVAAAAFVAGIEARGRRVDTPCGIDGDGGTMAWRLWGQDTGLPPVVLAHGAQGAWSHWIRNVEVLAARSLVIALDVPGQGDSALPATPDHQGISAAIAAGLRTILDALPRDPGSSNSESSGRQVDFVGFSFGGVALAHCAALHPGLARRLILVGCGGLDTPHGHIDLKRISGLRGEERRAVLKSNLLGLMLHHPESADDLAMYLLIANARKARLVDPKLVVPDRLLRILSDIPVPVDAIWAELDRPHPGPALQEAAIRSVRAACDFRVIAGSGHWAMYERSDAFNATLLDMLEANDQQAPSPTERLCG